MSTEVGGLQKRPPTVHIANLFKWYNEFNPLVHVVKRDEDEKYIMVFTGDGTCKVFDEYGTAYKVNMTPAAKNT